MFKNYLKVAIRNLRRYKGYSFINIFGLSIGMTVCILILLWVQDELSFDRFHEKADHIYRVGLSEKTGNKTGHWIVQAPALAPAMKTEFPEVIHSARFKPMPKRVIQYRNKRFYEDRFVFADQAFLEMFSFTLLRGVTNQALKEPSSILITKQMAKKYFDDEDPLGKILRIDNRLNLKVTGILNNIPSNSHLQFDLMVPFQLLKEYNRDIQGWRTWAYRTFVLLKNGTDIQKLTKKINGLLKKHNPETKISLWLQPLDRIHLYSSYINGDGSQGDIRFVTIFSMIAIFVLLMACINFMNLTTARSSTRAREVGMRKVAGARRREIIKQFFGESIFFSFVSLFFALALVSFLLPFFNSIAAKQLTFDILNHPGIILGILFITLFTGIVSGTYPAFFLASFQPVQVLKGKKISGSKGAFFRRLLVVFQFCLTIVLIIGTGINHQQMTFIKNQRLGFDKDHIVFVPLKGDLNHRIEALKQEWLGHPDIISATAVSNPDNTYHQSFLLEEWEGRQTEDGFILGVAYVDHDFLKTFNIKMKSGRFYTQNFSPDTNKGVVVNETAVKAMGMKDPLGKRIGDSTIMGVIKDFHNQSLHGAITPMELDYSQAKCRYICIKISGKNIERTIANLEKTWNRFTPAFPFQFRFLDDHINSLYRTDRRIGKIFNIFTLIAICIAFLGLFGLASFLTEQRTKEIGIRKTLGASVSNIILLLSSQFTRWVLVANVIAWPVAYIFMNKILQNYAYRTTISIWIFLASGLLSLLIALFSISYQSIKASLANPVEALRYE